MSFFFGRRHSVAGAASDSDGVFTQSRRRRSSMPVVRGQDEPESSKGGMFHDLFRRHREGPMTGMAQVAPKRYDFEEQSSPPKPTIPIPQPQQAEQPKNPPDDTAQPQRRSSKSSTSSRGSRRDAALAHDVHLTKEDIEILFSGAPYYLLEKGNHGHWYPQVIFPFDDHDPSIQNLWDRRPLTHCSYTLCTLHAHLPIPDGWVIHGDTPVHLDTWKRTGTPKRATFDVGMFETPNMLSMNGKEPGSVGFRHFLELPVCDAALYTGPAQAVLAARYDRISSMPATQAYEMMEHYNEPYGQCEDGTVHDRKELLSDGPAMWKKIGVRDVDLRVLVERLQELSCLRYDILHGQVATTILDRESPQDLYSGLFSRFLYLPPHFLLFDIEEAHSLKAQIKALTVVLATPGAWPDFNLVEWRLRLGQLLWEAPGHVDGDFLDPETIRKPWAHPTLERKWFLVQMVLAAELLLRLDATVRVGILDSFSELHISVRDVQDFDRTRTRKVDWDLVVVRRFMDCFNIAYKGDESGSASDASGPQDKKSEKHHHHSLFNKLAHRSSPPPPKVESAWKCRLVPSRIDQQLHGLFVFADKIGWPGLEDLKTKLQARTADGTLSQRVIDAYSNPVHNVAPAGVTMKPQHEMYSRSLSRRRLLLHHNSTDNTDSLGLGGWITRSWLSGFVVPGETINHLLMATILENDPAAMATLGPLANLYGGFAYCGRTWWSKESIVGRVLSSLDGTKECLGWLSSAILPRDSSTKEALDNTWLEVLVMPAPTVPGKPRIRHGNRISYESTPLGPGDLASGAFSLPIDAPIDREPRIKITFDAVTLSTRDGQPLKGKPRIKAHEACMAFTLSDTINPPTKYRFPLTYNVWFIASHECRPPGGFASYHNLPSNNGGNRNSTSSTTSSASTSSAISTTSHKHHRLPGHPLHRTYLYKTIPLSSLPLPQASETLFFEGSEIGLSRHEVMVLDARDPDSSSGKETFARAWCAAAGYNAIVSRESRTCLACSVREARAVGVKVVIRVGDGLGGSGRSSSRRLSAQV